MESVVLNALKQLQWYEKLKMDLRILLPRNFEPLKNLSGDFGIKVSLLQLKLYNESLFITPLVNIWCWKKNRNNLGLSRAKLSTAGVELLMVKKVEFQERSTCFSYLLHFYLEHFYLVKDAKKNTSTVQNNPSDIVQTIFVFIYSFVYLIKQITLLWRWSQSSEPQKLTRKPGHHGHAASRIEESPLITDKFYFIAVASVNLFKFWSVLQSFLF